MKLEADTVKPDPEYSITPEEFRSALREAIAAKQTPYVATSRELFIDLDNDGGGFQERLDWLRQWYVVLDDQSWESKTPGHKHIILKLDQSLSVPERIILQIFLGSDSKRGIFELLRHQHGIEGCVRLFRPEQKVDLTAANGGSNLPF